MSIKGQEVGLRKGGLLGEPSSQSISTMPGPKNKQILWLAEALPLPRQRGDRHAPPLHPPAPAAGALGVEAEATEADMLWDTRQDFTKVVVRQDPEGLSWWEGVGRSQGKLSSSALELFQSTTSCAGV